MQNASEKNNAIIALVGDNMKSHQGISGKMFSTLGKNNVNIRGYVKDLRIFNYSKPTNWIQDNFIHNRINIKIPIKNPTHVDVHIIQEIRPETNFKIGESSAQA